jgi:hypothetical protein
VVLALLVGLGTAGGYGIGKAADWVRDVWPEPVPALAAAKVAPPRPVDVSGPSQVCPAASLRLQAVPDRTSLGVGGEVTFTVTITDVGRRPCLVDGGDASRQLVVTNATDAVVYSSAHCNGEPRDLLLGPGDVDTQVIAWDGRFSAAGTCTDGQDVVPAGQYTVQIVMAGIPDAVSDPVQLTVGTP